MALPDGQSQHFDIGVVYGADSMVALGQWIGEAVQALTGRSSGSRTAGFATLPGGQQAGDSGIGFVQISALGNSWPQKLEGVFDTSNYREAQRFFDLLQNDTQHRQQVEHLKLFSDIGNMTSFFPTVDMYGPVPIL